MKKDKPLNKFLLTVSALCVSLLLCGVSAPSLVMAYVYEAFPEISTDLIPILLTLPLLLEIPASIIGGVISSKVKKRPYLLVVSAIFMIGGIGPFFVDNFYVMLCLRALLGIGVGLALPLSSGLIPLFFKDEKDQNMVFGYQATFVNIGGVLMSYIGGLITVNYWKNIFWVYLTGAIVALIVLFIMPEPEMPVSAAAKDDPAEKPKFKLTPTVWLVFGCGLLKGILAYVIFTHMSLLIIGEGIGNTVVAGTAQSCIMIGGMLVGLIYGVVFNKIRSHMIWLGTAMMAVCYFVCGATSSVILLYIFFFIHGMSSNIQNSTLSRYASYVVEPQFIPIMTGTSMALNFGGQFLSSIVLSVVSGFFGMSDTRSYFTFGGILCAIVAVVSFIAVVANRTKAKNKAAHA